MRSRRKSIKISGSGAGPSAMSHSAMPPPPTRMTYNTNPMLNRQFESFKSKNELKQAVQDYFTNKIRRDEVINEYGNISDWNTSSITDMSSIFNNIIPLADDIAENKLIQLNWDTSNVTNMSHMFAHCYLNFKINFTDTSQVTDMSFMFEYTPIFNQPLPESFNTSKVTNMNGMFCRAHIFNQHLPSSFDTSNVTNMSHMFDEATEFNGSLPQSFNTSKVTDMSYMFAFATNFNQPLVFDTHKVTNMHSMFEGAGNFNQPIRFVTDITNFNGLKGMFNFTTNLESLISIKLGDGFRKNIKVKDVFEGSKIMEHPEYIKITEHEISVLGDDIHMFAYALTEADKRHASKTGTIRKYPAHTIDFDEFNEFLRK